MIREFRDYRIFGKDASELTSARQNLSGAGIFCGVSLHESNPTPAPILVLQMFCQVLLRQAFPKGGEVYLNKKM